MFEFLYGVMLHIEMEMLRDFEDAMITICQMQNDDSGWGANTDQMLQFCGETLLEEYSAWSAPTSHSCWRNSTAAGERIDSARTSFIRSNPLGDSAWETINTTPLGNQQDDFTGEDPTNPHVG
jgi:hypothetical protein